MHQTGPALLGSSTVPRCLHWGFALSLPLAKDGPGGGSSQSCVLPALAGAAPPASAHWLMVPLGINYAFRTRGYSNGKIVYLQLGELKAEAEERVAPHCHGRPPAPLSRLPRDGSSCFHLGISILGGPMAPQPHPTPSCPVFCCLPGHSSMAGRIQPISPSADFLP